MREILFRGKRLDNGEWVEGFLICPLFAKSKAYIGTLFAIDDHDTDVAEVDPQTVGQYTGLTDKNGVKIFEGDIIQTKYGRLCEVVWRSNSAVNCWDITPLECMHRSPDEWDLWDSKNLSVVGNIYDNPELMDGH